MGRICLCMGFMILKMWLKLWWYKIFCWFLFVARPVGRARMVFFVVYNRVFCIFIWGFFMCLIIVYPAFSF